MIINGMEYTFRRITKRESEIFERKWELEAFIGYMQGSAYELELLKEKLLQGKMKEEQYSRMYDFLKKRIDTYIKQRWGDDEQGISKPTRGMAEKLSLCVTNPIRTAEEWLNQIDFDIIAFHLNMFLNPQFIDKYSELRRIIEESKRTTWTLDEIIAQFKYIDNLPEEGEITKN